MKLISFPVNEEMSLPNAAETALQLVFHYQYPSI